ncbi:MAG: 2Fe-2S iron-sulfur cluster-binding protein, partial [Alphaproteobacteria bacterium]
MRDYVTFILNNEIQQVSDLAGDMTLLAWLRQRRRLTGTKEGCAEGDCGACTVALARADASGKIIWRPVNACILFMGMLEGASITTVEGLSDGAGGLHPVQQAMVDFHASQCGFCTPGFVMSLFAAWCNGTGLEPETIDDTLAGNLCRCTGYRPIVDAGTALAG